MADNPYSLQDKLRMIAASDIWSDDPNPQMQEAIKWAHETLLIAADAIASNDRKPRKEARR